ncbi:MAG: HAD-IC family P-type ATPase, partial [Rhodothermales bacterium]
EPLEDAQLVAGDQVNMAFAGTVVIGGRGRAVVVRTGASTELGQIAESMRDIGETKSPLQVTMDRFGKRIGAAIVGLSVLVAVVGVLRAMPPEEIFLAAVAMAVSAIPEGLPVVLTLTFAIGVRRMAQRQAIIRSLPAVETLGSATLIGSDKTGTLTKNEMTVKGVWAAGRFYELTGAGYSPDGAVRLADRSVNASEIEPLKQTLLAGALANEADTDFLAGGDPSGDPTELALHVAAAKGGIHPHDVRDAYEQVDLIPFEPELRFMASLNETPDGRRLYVKGAPEVLIDRCERQLGPEGLQDLQADEIREAADELARQGYRVLAMAYRSFDGDKADVSAAGSDLVFAGLQGMEDPVREEAVQAVRDAHQAGIRVVMLTGDHKETALAIGRRLDLDPEEHGVVEGKDLDGLSDDELDPILDSVNVYARVAPEHKLRIVQRLSDRGEVVAVTGDGVNDAPALRAAHLGIAMGKGGTDVAREASDIVLTDDNFATITAAVEEGRVVYSNIRKVTFFLLSTAVGEVIAITLAILAGWPLPFVAAQILWINLVTNGLQDVALAFEKGEPGLLRRPPRSRKEGIVTRRLLERLGSVGLVLAAGTLGMFWWTLETTGDLDLARTVAMTQMVMFQFFHVFNCRSLDRSVFAISPFSNRFLFVSISAALAAHLAVIYVPWLQTIFRTVPLTPGDWLVITLVATSVIIGGELDKWWNRRRHRPLG